MTDTRPLDTRPLDPGLRRCTLDRLMFSFGHELDEVQEFSDWRRGLCDAGLYPFETIRHGAQRPRVRIERDTMGDTFDVLNFANYNYLGLGSHPDVIRAAPDAVGRYGLGAACAPNLSGEQVDFYIATFSKSFSGVGGALIAHRDVTRDVNWYAKSRLFSCALDPGVTGGDAEGAGTGQGRRHEAARFRPVRGQARLLRVADRLRDQRVLRAAGRRPAARVAAHRAPARTAPGRRPVQSLTPKDGWMYGGGNLFEFRRAENQRNLKTASAPVSHPFEGIDLTGVRAEHCHVQMWSEPGTIGRENPFFLQPA